MVDVIFIDDNYIYRNYPLPQRFDRAALLSIITMEQVTSIQDLLGTALYEDIQSKVSTQTLSSTEEGLFKLVQYSLCLYSVKASATLMRASIGYTKNEQDKLDQSSIDAIVNAIDSKISYINKRITNYIKADTALLAMADTSTDDKFVDEDTYNGSSIFYPIEPLDTDC